jgi:hypothetical protein
MFTCLWQFLLFSCFSGDHVILYVATRVRRIHCLQLQGRRNFADESSGIISIAKTARYHYAGDRNPSLMLESSGLPSMADKNISLQSRSGRSHLHQESAV